MAPWSRCGPQGAAVWPHVVLQLCALLSQSINHSINGRFRPACGEHHPAEGPACRDGLNSYCPLFTISKKAPPMLFDEGGTGTSKATEHPRSRILKRYIHIYIYIFFFIGPPLAQGPLCTCIFAQDMIRPWLIHLYKRID